MAWTQRKIELELKRKLKKEFSHDGTQADKYYSYYTKALATLLSDDIYNSIRSLRPDLSDHGENHVMNVLDNAFELLVHRKYQQGSHKLISEHIEDVTAIELYFICVLILFHDVGNLTAERKTHNQAHVIREIYNYVRKLEKEF